MTLEEQLERMSGPRNRRAKKQAAARAREGRARLRLGLCELRVLSYEPPLSQAGAVDQENRAASGEVEEECESVCSWDGGVDSWSDAESDLANWVEDDDLRDSGDHAGRDSDGNLGGEAEEVEELEGTELTESLERAEAHKTERLKSAYDVLMRGLTARDWNGRYGAERRQRLGVYNGQSPRTKRWQRQKAAEEEEKHARTRQT